MVVISAVSAPLQSLTLKVLYRCLRQSHGGISRARKINFSSIPLTAVRLYPRHQPCGDGSHPSFNVTPRACHLEYTKATFSYEPGYVSNLQACKKGTRTICTFSKWHTISHPLDRMSKFNFLRPRGCQHKIIRFRKLWARRLQRRQFGNRLSFC